MSDYEPLEDKLLFFSTSPWCLGFKHSVNLDARKERKKGREEGRGKERASTWSEVAGNKGTLGKDCKGIDHDSRGSA